VTRPLAAATFVLLGGVATTQAFDLKDFIACKAAAIRMCDGSHVMTVAALLRCGATLASRRHEVGNGCLEVLKRYGQLEGDARRIHSAVGLPSDQVR